VYPPEDPPLREITDRELARALDGGEFGRAYDVLAAQLLLDHAATDPWTRGQVFVQRIGYASQMLGLIAAHEPPSDDQCERMLRWGDPPGTEWVAQQIARARTWGYEGFPADVQDRNDLHVEAELDAHQALGLETWPATEAQRVTHLYLFVFGDFDRAAYLAYAREAIALARRPPSEWASTPDPSAPRWPIAAKQATFIEGVRSRALPMLEARAKLRALIESLGR
jgi:hypothetical protein